MPKRLNREYKKGKPFRDSKKFVIVAEGEREDDYFRYFNNINMRIQIEVAPRDGGKSAAKFLIERATDYIDKNGLEPNDLLWFVLDVDRWPRKEIDNLKLNCDKNPNWNVAISNPCFEIWLYFHYGDPTKLKIKTAKAFKTKLGSLISGGYKINVFAQEIEQAAINARKADVNPDHFFPNVLTSKVYTLAEEMIQFLGRNWKV